MTNTNRIINKIKEEYSKEAIYSDCLTLTQETNDKFIGCNGDIMDLVCYTYYLLPEFLKKFNEKGILLEGQATIQHRIKQLKQIKKINKCHMLGHYNTYYKCQGRHKIKFKKT